MKLLVLGGTHHVGRAIVETALERGDVVTTLNRGMSRPPAAGVEALIADRMDRDAVQKALGQRTWDAVIDTWAFAPRAVRDTAELLVDRVGHYGYVSSRGVHQWPWPSGADEQAPLIEGDPDSEDGTNYAAAKRGGEIAVVNAFGECALLARAGMIIGPFEDVGRIPWWMRRLERGGQVIAPSPASTPLQFVDARDIARWMLSAAERGIGGAYNVASQPGYATMRDLLETMREVIGSDAELVWVDVDVLEREELMVGMEMGIRKFPGLPAPTGIHDANVTAAFHTGLICRPLRETLADTWAWIQSEGYPTPPSYLPSPDTWVDPEKEKVFLAKLNQPAP